MLTTLLVILSATSVYCQINGEFWWLNKKLNDYRNVRPMEPIIEDLDDFVNDENSKIVFRDDDLLTNNLSKQNPMNIKQNYYEYTGGKIVWPTESGKNNNSAVVKQNMDVAESKDQKNNKGDVFVFNFPKNNGTYLINLLKTTESVPQTTTPTENSVGSDILFNDDKISSYKDKDAQHICTYIKKKNCFQNNGLVYSEWKQNEQGDQDIVCCVLPIKPLHKSDYHSAISFPGETHRKLRHKRSENEDQRKFLLLRKFSQHKKNHLTPNPTPKIVTPSEDEYVDPYWNIKNSKFLTQQSHKIVTPSYNNEDYGEYASELPRPGLLGLYSDHDKSPSSWTFTSNTGFSYGGVPDDFEDDDIDDDDDDDDNDDTFGYSTIDPRKVSGKKKQKVKPVKFTTVSGEVTLDAESHTINFQSNPDFQVLQGFKLLNLFRNRSRVHSKKRKTTAERNDDSKEFLGARPVESAEIEEQFFEEDQLFGGCGKAVALKATDKEKQHGDASNGSHPWMALVVLTKRRQNVLCYATLIHPRAAITVADCVQGTSSRDVTVIAGAWDLNNRSRLKTRVADIQFHPRYKPGEDDNNLAVLYWMRPLKLGANVQPACLGEPHVGDDCRFFGWGSLDQGIQTRSKWQRASIRMCDSRGLKKRTKPSDNFCADVSRGSVTSMGGPLICDIEGHSYVVGVVMSRDDGYLLIPVRDFAMGSNELLTGD